EKTTPRNSQDSTTQFLVRRGQICSIAKEDPHGIVQEVQPGGSYFLGWDKDVAPYHKKFKIL
ncbi:MAG: hypothetical protein J6U48_06685, partial [Alistipes sp.]|nr:hypothetical protein [Alistipes sp.]